MTVKVNSHDAQFMSMWGRVDGTDFEIWEDGEVSFEVEELDGTTTFTLSLNDLEEIVEEAKKFVEARKERKNA